MKIGIIGTGNVGTSLAEGLIRAGHEVALGSRIPSKIEGKGKASVGSRAEAAKFGDVVFLAVPYGAVVDTVRAIGPNALNGKVLVDVTNAVGQNRELAVGLITSAAEELQKQVPGAHVVKAFNTVFANLMGHGKVGNERITLFVAADDNPAKETVMRLGSDIGFDAVDAGPLKSARYMEPMGMQMISLGYGLGMGSKIGLRLLRE